MARDITRAVSNYMGDEADLDATFGEDRTMYDPISDTLRCGCDPNWADHRCRYGCSVCGAPDDCYCPSLSERLEAYTEDVTFPAILIADHYDFNRPGVPLYQTRHMTHCQADLVSVILDFDMDDTDIKILHHDLTTITKL